jgi:glycosyltransferase involved in cell wall biosynthesis
MALKISVITAVRNNVRTIADAIDSVASQSYPQREHVIIDGASTDGTVQLLEQHRHRLQALRSEPDTGVYDAFNKGVRLATGDVVCFLGADDFYESDDIFEQVAAAFAAGDVDIVYGDVVMVKSEDTSAVVRFYSSAPFTTERIARGFMPAHPSMFVRRSLFERLGLFDTSYRIAGDFHWVARALTAGKARYRHVPRTFVRMRLGGLSTRGLRSTVRITREIRRACRELGITTNYLRLLSRLPEKLLEYRRRPARSAAR